MITFEESILMTVILENIEQELSVEQTSPQPRRSPSPLLTVYSIVMGRFWKVSCEQCALSRIREVNMLSFIEITPDIYDLTFEKNIPMTIILQNIGQELSLE